MPIDSVIDRGTGPALVLVPGLPGPWEYVRPAVDALAASFRVLTFSLGSECSIAGDADRILSMLAERGIDRAVVCGISLGGLVAARFAVIHPERTAALVLVSAPGPGARLRPHHRWYTRWPRLCGPLFLVETPFRLRREIACALPRVRDRWAFGWSQMKTLGAAPVAFSVMARRARLIDSTDLAEDCAKITAPTLVVTGEPALDRVVSVASTSEYARLIPGARTVILPSTGHLGSITHPDAFAAVVERPSQGRDGGTGRPAPHSEVA
jgi:3-oxoadipate enol-lactonase